MGRGIDPLEIRRRVGAVDVRGLKVLDLTDPDACAMLRIDEQSLTGEDYTLTQAIAIAAADAGFDGILCPSVALPGRRTLVVFPGAMARVQRGWEAVRTAPPRLRTLRRVIPARKK